ncbi:hypothetical protein PFISCL1PPCAC_13714, partial [Pristionchus fissidentatus]
SFFASQPVIHIFIIILSHLSSIRQLQFWYSGPGILAFFSIAPWSNHVGFVKITIQIWFFSFAVVSICIMCSFIYRYGLLCRLIVLSVSEFLNLLRKIV